MKKNSENENSRRKFIRDLGAILGTTALAVPSFAYINKSFGNSFPLGLSEEKKLGIALVGLGNYSSGQLAPALQETKFCKLTGIVTGSPEKVESWKKKYNIPDKNVYNYQNFDQIKDNPDIDIVYVVLPNSMHAEYTIRAAKAGKHVICEKPMATTVEDCQKMIDACKTANRMLSIGYRMHFEPHTAEVMRLGQQKVLGQVKKIKAEFGFPIQPNVWRLDKELAGGGPLMDVGIYCVQASMYTLGEEPVSVTAKFSEKKDVVKFREVEEAISWTMEFPSGAIAYDQTSYADYMHILRADATDGWFELEPAFSYHGVKGKSSKGKILYPDVNQQALQMDDFANCVINKKKTKVPGEMGMRDVKILLAIYEAAQTGNKISLKQSELSPAR